MVSPIVIMLHEGINLSLEVAGQVIVLQQQPVLHALMPALDLALCHRVVGGATDIRHAVSPGEERGRYVTDLPGFAEWCTRQQLLS